MNILRIFHFFQNFVCQSPKQFQLPSIPENVSNITNDKHLCMCTMHDIILLIEKLIIKFISLCVSEKFD